MHMGKEEVRRKYEGFASKYDRWEGIGEFLLIGRLRKKLLRRVHGNVLDVGIGTGKNLRYYSRRCSITGIDYSLAMLAVAEKRAEELGRKARLIEGDAERLPFKKGEFDCVVDTLGLCTYPNPVKALKEMKRVCKKEGRIFLLEHGRSSNGVLRWIQEKVRKKQLERLGCHVERDIAKSVKQAGLEIMSVKRRFFGVFYIIEARD